MKTNIQKIINIGLVSALLGAGLFYFAENEESLRGWLPFYGEWSGRTQSELLEVPAGASVNGVALPVGSVNAYGIPVLMYHGILNTIESEDVANTSTKTFGEQMKMLKDEGYTTIDTRDLYGFIKGESGLPAKPIIVTFDDGRIDSVKNGDPILRQYGFKAVMFVPVNKQNNGDKFFLSWDNLSDMMRSGRWDIEFHGGDRFHTSVVLDQSGESDHFASNKEWLTAEGRLETDEEYGQRLIEDIKKGKSDLEKNLPGIELVAFAFPYGDYGQGAVNVPAAIAIQKNHDAIDDLFPISFGFVGSHVEGDDFNFFHYDGADSHLIKRLDVKDTLSADRLRGLLRIYTNKEIPFVVDRFDESLMPSIITVRGSAVIKSGDLDMRVPADDEGSIAIVTGTSRADYRFESDITLDAGQTGFLMSRYADIDNYLLCGVDGKDISFRQVVGGTSVLIKSAPYADTGSKNFHVVVEAIGTMVSCSVNGTTVGRYHVDPVLRVGGIGFKAWDPEKGKSDMTVRSVSVTDSRAVAFEYTGNPSVGIAATRKGSDGATLRIIAPAWYRFDEEGYILLNEEGMNNVKTKTDEDSSVFPAIGNRYSAAGAGSEALIHSILMSEAFAENAIESAVALMLDRGFMGISLDIENVAAADKDAYADFIRRLSERMHEHHLVLVMDLSAKTGENDARRLKGIDREKISEYADVVVPGN